MRVLYIALVAVNAFLYIDATISRKLSLLDELEEILDDLESGRNGNTNASAKRQIYSCGKSMVDNSLIRFDDRIVGGKPVTPHQYPWLAMVYYKNKMHCGASVIGHRWILTAAHCVYKNTKGRFNIYLGVHSQSNSDFSKEQDLTVKGIHIHPYYNPKTVNNDIAILEVNKYIKYDKYVQPICLTAMAIPEGSKCIITGWGKTSYGGSLSDVLQSAQVEVVPQSVCVHRYAGVGPVTQKMFCASGNGVDSCQGDSGGPVVEVSDGVYKQYGIVSSGMKCADPFYPGVYTRVSKFITWIKSVTKNEVEIYDDSNTAS